MSLLGGPMDTIIQWLIQVSQEGDAKPKGSTSLLFDQFFSENYMKMKKKIGPDGGMICVLSAPYKISYCYLPVK